MSKVNCTLKIVGAGPAGLMAAQAAADMGCGVDLYDAMPTIGRKFLMAGKGGLNLTHGEAPENFPSRYGSAAPIMARFLEAFGPREIVAWCHDLGIDTVTGSSNRIFPAEFKAAPLLRAWARRLKALGVRFHQRHSWQGWTEDGSLKFRTPDGEIAVPATTTVLAVGGGSWPKLGSDGAWVGLLAEAGVEVAALRPSNCGLRVGWSAYLRDRFSRQPLKSVVASFNGRSVKGDVMITPEGLEGGPIYALSGSVRDWLDEHGTACLTLDLCPDRSPENVATALAQPHGSRSLPSHLKRALKLSPLAIALLHEAGEAPAPKAVALTVTGTSPLAEAISSAGGVRWADVDDGLMLRAKPGLFVVGEMLDWEAPTGGYLLTACLSTGHWAGRAAARYEEARLTLMPEPE